MSRPGHEHREVGALEPAIEPGKLIAAIEHPRFRRIDARREPTREVQPKAWQPVIDELGRPVTMGDAGAEVDDVHLELLPPARWQAVQSPLRPPTSRVT